MCTRIPRGRDCRYDGALSNTWVGPESTNSGCLDRGEGWGGGLIIPHRGQSDQDQTKVSLLHR